MNPATLGVFIPISAIVFGIGIGMLAIWVGHKRKSQLLEQLHRERMHALDKGLEPPPIPEHLVGNSEGSAPDSAAKAMRNGVMLVLIGAVLWIGIGQTGGEEAAWFGLIPAAVGVGNLLYALSQWKKERRS
ncbi:MAG TPA: DUF6249 domain-containing protein [Steroidobacteraceae bacterium]|nr:DUF6249 domain-containing protein [Steroidobacteraceae bacterium]